jgi:hypothetical protein
MLQPTELSLQELKGHAREVEPAPTDLDVCRRALATYLRLRREGMPDRPLLLMYRGKRYAALVNGSRTLAVYRIRNDGMLKHMRRVPLPVAAYAELSRIENGLEIHGR